MQSLCPKMQTSDKLCLKWNDFQENLNSAFGGLRNDKEFVDVTLACEDGSTISAHKVILAASSPFFMEILAKNKHPHPLIYMRGIGTRELIAIVDFVYFGEANVEQEHLDAFLGLAEEMRLKGLTGSAERSDGKTENPQQNIVPNMQNSTNIDQNSKAEDIFLKMPVALDKGLVTEEHQELDEQIKSMMEVGETTLTVGNRSVRAKKCKVCGKEGHTSNIMTHIESNHITTSNISHSCNICGKISRSRHGLRLHTAREHRLSNN